jgi:hypothetical protein
VRFNVLLRAAIEVDADTQEHAIERARLVVDAAPSLLTVARVIEQPLRHGEREPEPASPPLVHRAHYRAAGRPVMRDRRGA